MPLTVRHSLFSSFHSLKDVLRIFEVVPSDRTAVARTDEQDRTTETSLMMLIPNLGATITLILGCLGLLFPDRVSELLGIRGEGPLGKSELRATYGGFFLCLGAGCLATQSDTVFMVAGSAWWGAAIARSISLFVDNSRSWKNLLGLVIEATIGAMLLIGAFRII